MDIMHYEKMKGLKHVFSSLRVSRLGNITVSYESSVHLLRPQKQPVTLLALP